MKTERPMDKDASISVAGHHGLVGAAICRRLEGFGFTKLIKRPRKSLDLRNQAAVEQFFGDERPQYAFLAAAQ